MQSGIVCVVFFLSFILCGCSVESVFDDRRACVVVVVALIVCVVSAAVITGGDE